MYGVVKRGNCSLHVLAGLPLSEPGALSFFRALW